MCRPEPGHIGHIPARGPPAGPAPARPAARLAAHVRPHFGGTGKYRPAPSRPQFLRLVGPWLSKVPLLVRKVVPQCVAVVVGHLHDNRGAVGGGFAGVYVHRSLFGTGAVRGAACLVDNHPSLDQVVDHTPAKIAPGRIPQH